ncbi:Morn repeat [Chlorella sorokiniana]|jgi:hypothetical protein|uniref:Morn repeat n=1 Tax=Chlorella sorokiniana TaxID=3076 RepID=A0A2P6TWH9_CHLSO|nr:Morn repeat [Chlorella sorokiniana]|eukprot:PRW58419.1 Morn repeat [Chlorella sorokiniana]
MTGMKHRLVGHRRGGAATAAAAGENAPASDRPTASCSHSRAVIVHPRFQHTLGDPPVAAEPPPVADWRSLPPEVVEHVGSFLDKAQDLLNLSATCKDARPLARSDRLWKALCCRRYGVPPQQPPSGEDAFWRRLYQCNHQLFLHIVRSSSGGSPPGPRFGQGPLVINLA